MKKFITTIPLQPSGELASSIYEAVDNEKLQYNKEIAFPIIAVMNAYIEAGEKVIVYTIRQDDARTEGNKVKFQNQIKEFEAEKKCQCIIEEILINNNELITTHLETFEKLIEKFEKADEIYACMTYGTKPIPIIEMMSLNYAYRTLKDVSIECIVYGWYRFPTKEAKIFDITSLFYLDEVVRNAADINLENPLKFIKNVLALQEAGDE